jgi:hypothetical protein
MLALQAYDAFMDWRFIRVVSVDSLNRAAVCDMYGVVLHCNGPITSLIDAFSKKLMNHEPVVALYSCTTIIAVSTKLRITPQSKQG